MPISAEVKQNKAFFLELPYHGQSSIIQWHGKFNNLLTNDNHPSKKYLDRFPSLYDVDIFSLNSVTILTTQISLLFILSVVNTTPCLVLVS